MNYWARLTHRWVSIAFTLGFITNGIAVALKRYSAAIGLLALIPLLVLLVTGLYLFLLPYVAKWRWARHTR